MSYLKIAEICEKYRVSHETVRRWHKTGVKLYGNYVRLRAVKVGGTWRVRESELEHFLRGLQPPTADPEVSSPSFFSPSAATVSQRQRESEQLSLLLAPRGRASRAPRRIARASARSTIR